MQLLGQRGELMEIVAQSIMSKLGQLVVEELQEIRGVGDKVVHLTDELATMNALLRMISEADESAVDHLVGEWEKQVRELAYDAEDCADIYRLRVCWRRPTLLLLPYIIVKWPKHQLEKLWLRRNLAADVKALVARAGAVSERRTRYHIDQAALPRSSWFAPVSAAASASASARLRRADDDPVPDHQIVGIREQADTLIKRIKAFALNVNKALLARTSCPVSAASASDDDPEHQLVGIREQADTLAERIKAIHVEDDKKLKVFSIVGFGGLGKTTLAVELCRRLKADFQCQALVSVSQTFDGSKDVKGLLDRLLHQIAKLKEEKIDEMDVVNGLSSKLEEHLKEKRYLIVIDDVWSLPAWEAIRDRLPKNNNLGSRIIVTTRIETVAKASSVSEEFVHHIKPLEPKASEELFVKRVFGSEDSCPCPDGLKDTMGKILKKCGGLPLAIVKIASILARYNSVESVEIWTRVSKSIGSQMENHPTLEGMRRVITLSYGYLPHHLKACMLYLSIFPEDYVIAKNRLLYRWIAEGFVAEKRGLTLFEVAQEYFDELISRNMIQASKLLMVDEYIYCPEIVEACRVHDMMLEVMVSRSQDANFVCLVGRQHGGGLAHGKVRRLSVHGNVEDDDEEEKKAAESRRRVRHGGIEAMNLQHVRSLSTFQVEDEGLHGKLLDRLGEFRLLRVLDLEGCKSLRDKHMRDVCRMYLLRFLGLRSTPISVMPSEIGDLECLESLDVEETKIHSIPPTVTKLSKLERLRVPRWSLPRGLGNMKSLLEVVFAILQVGDVQVARDIGKLQQLRVLIIQLGKEPEEVPKDDFLRELASSLSKTCSLQTLKLESVSRNSHVKVMDFLLHVSSPPPLLRSLALHGRISWFPDWISSLEHLTGFSVMETELPGDQLLDSLCQLPSLQILKLGNKSYRGTELVARTKHKFAALRILDVYISPEFKQVKFEERSMAKLEALLLDFHYPQVDQVSIVGIDSLKNLKEVKLKDHKDSLSLNHALQQLKKENENRPKSNQIKLVVEYWW